MMLLYDEEEIMRSYVESERHEAIIQGREEGKQEGRQDEKIETARRMLKIGKFSYEEIAMVSGIEMKEVKKLAENL